MLHKTIPHTQVYYQLFFTVSSIQKNIDGFAIIFRTQMEMTKQGRKQSDNSPPGWIFLSQMESFGMVYVLHENLSQLGTNMDEGHVAVSGCILQ
jgi:hypothetical protein